MVVVYSDTQTDATISNVGVEDVSIDYGNSTADGHGALVGVAKNTTITNSYSTGVIDAQNNVGGLVGYLNNSTITNSYSAVEVIGDYSAIGGLVGIMSSGSTIASSYATGNVTGNNMVGGLVGSASGTIRYSYSTGDVTGKFYSYLNQYDNNSDQVGGFVGYMNNGVTISNSFASGNVSIDSSGRVGGFTSGGYGTIINSAFSTESSGQTSGGDSDVNALDDSGLATFKNQILQNTKGFNNGSWNLTSDNPTLNVKPKTTVSEGTLYINGTKINVANGELTYALRAINDVSSQTGVVAVVEDGKVVLKNADGSNKNIELTEGSSNFFSVIGYNVTGPISEEAAIAKGYTVIKTADDLKKMAEEIEASDNGAYDKTYVLLADIDMTGVDWTPVSNTFYGVLDGNGHTISNLNINSSERYVGLFASL